MENRRRNKMISFRVSPEEYLRIEARTKISGMTKAQYIIQSLLNEKINIAVGKYQSDRLSLELHNLRIAMELAPSTYEIEKTLKECKALLAELETVISDSEQLKAK
mgnify:CR=1 FL=1